ncbi:site-specific DNA-methyltransferase, partial [Actinotignum urinale]
YTSSFPIFVRRSRFSYGSRQALNCMVNSMKIDPPYNTGKDFVYSDNYSDSIGSYLELTGQTDEGGKLSTNSESTGRFHSNWLNMMYPRLKLARNLLAQDGFIFISIDESEHANLKKLCDELYGEHNYRNTLIVRRRTKSLNSQFSPRGLTSLNVGAESILVYTKSDQATLFPLHVKKKHIQKKGRWDVFWSGADRPTMRYELLGFTPTEGQWRNSQEKALEAVQNYETFLKEYSHKETIEQYSSRTGIRKFIRRITNGTGKNGGVQHWVAPSETMLRTSLWADLESSQIRKEIDLPFDNPKSRVLVQELIKLANLRENDLVLDFFAGSGTTAHAVMKLNAEDGGNRRCISVQLPEPTPEGSAAREAGFETIADISRERIRRAGKKILEEEASKLDGRADTLDVGFRAYKLVDTNFTKWKADSGLSEDELVGLFADLADSADNHARPEALLIEVLLKLGFSLTERIETVEVAGLSVFSVADGLVLAYLDEHTQPTLDQLRALAGEEPGRLVVLEDAFQGNDELKTNLVQECHTRNIDLWTA